MPSFFFARTFQRVVRTSILPSSTGIEHRIVVPYRGPSTLVVYTILNPPQKTGFFVYRIHYSVRRTLWKRLRSKPEGVREGDLLCDLFKQQKQINAMAAEKTHTHIIIAFSSRFGLLGHAPPGASFLSSGPQPTAHSSTAAVAAAAAARAAAAAVAPQRRVL